MNNQLSSLLASVLCTACVLCTASTSAEAQCIQTATGRFQADGSPCNNTIITALPFLRIVPDARFGAMGDVGIAMSPDPNSLHFNASNIAFAERDVSISATYTPWLRALGLTDVYLAHLSGYKNIDKFQTLAASLRFFSLGQIQYTDEQGNSLQTVRPREIEFATAYTRKLTKNFSTGLTLKYIYSNLGTGATSSGDVLRPAHAFAADISFTYRQQLKLENKKKATLAFGLAFSNIGNKISYVQSANRDYLPANMGFGSSFEYEIDEHNSITFGLDISKLMVPTPVPSVVKEVNGIGDTVFVANPDYDTNGNGVPEYKELSVPSSIISSFGDASFGEEMRELMYSFGFEYWYNKQFAFRLGHYNEHKTKGNRKFVTVGLGLRYNVFCINFSYLIPTFNAQRNPLDNTLRFSLMMDFGHSKASGKKPAPTPKDVTPSGGTGTEPEKIEKPEEDK